MKNTKSCDDITDPRILARWEIPAIDADVHIHCPECVLRKLKVFRDENGFKTYWSAVLYLLNHYKEGIPKPGSHVITAEKGKKEG